MIRWLLVSFLLGSLAPVGFPAGAQGESRKAVLSRLRSEIRELRRKAFEEEQRYADLLKLRIFWDLLLPVDPGELTRGLGVPGRSIEEMQRELRAELVRESRLRAQYYRQGPRDVPIPPIPIRPRPTPGPAAEVPEASTEKEPRTRGPDPVALSSPGETSPFGPRLGASEKPGPRLPPFSVLNPFGVDAQVRARLMPSGIELKRIDALLRAGLPELALTVIARNLEAFSQDNATPDPGLYFMLGRARERAGDRTGAIEAFSKVLELDKLTDAEGKTFPGPWAKAATFSMAFANWAEKGLILVPPDLDSLKW